jgi:NTP pyrophosphatase (non-canonical NTP hydrolase)
MISESTIQALRDFNKERDWDQYHSPENLSKSICIEAAELLECFQWSNSVQGKVNNVYEIQSDHIEDELADVLSYCIMLADKLDCDMDKIVLRKLGKTKAKYPSKAVKDNFDEYAKRHIEARKKG